MAKVTLVLEDKISEDGTNGMTIQWDVEPKIDDTSLAVNYAQGFVDYIVSVAKDAKYIMEDEIESISGETLN